MKRFDLATALGTACGRIIRWWRHTSPKHRSGAAILIGVALLVIIWVIHIQNVATVTLTFAGLVVICAGIMWRVWDATKNDDWTL